MERIGYNMKTFKLLIDNLSVLRKFFNDDMKKIITLITACALMFFATPLIIPFATGNVISAIEVGTIDTFIWNLILLAMVLIVVVVCIVIYMIFAEGWMVRISSYGITRLLRKIYTFPLVEFQKIYPDGELFNRLFEGSGSAVWTMSQMMTSISMLLGVAAIIMMLGRISPWFLLLAVAVAALELIRTVFETRYKLKLAALVQKHHSLREERLLLALKHISELMIMKEMSIFHEYGSIRSQALEGEIKNARLSAVLDVVIGVFYAGLYAALFLMANPTVSGTPLMMGTFSGALMLFNRLGAQFIGIRMEWNTMTADLSNVGRLSDMISYQSIKSNVSTEDSNIRNIVHNDDITDGQSEDSNKKSIINIDNITFTQNENIIIKDFSLTMHDKEKIAIMGRNGSGKTTLLKIILGFITSNSGQASIFGKPLTNCDYYERRRLISYASSDDALFPVNGKDNVAFGNDDEEGFIVPGLDKVLLSKDPGAMSGGNKKEIAIYRALSHAAKLLVLDEPTASLDSHETEKVVDKILEYAGAAIVVTHDPSIASRFDRVIVLGGETGGQRY